MTGAEEGILLLCCRLGDPESSPLTPAQFRNLGKQVLASPRAADPLRDLTSQDLTELGCSHELSQRILRLLNRESQLYRYLAQAEHRGIYPITRLSPAYPRRIAGKYGTACPPVLFAMGDCALLQAPSVAVVGSRQLLPENEAFAKDAGRLAAQDHLVLVSGGAIGADQTAQNACLDAGGSCILFVADRLETHSPQDRVLYLSEDGFDVPFSPARALHRNKLIHMQGDRTIAAQCTYGTGGTWQGCTENLKHHWSPLFVFDDHSPAMTALMEQGATGIDHLTQLETLTPAQTTFFDH